MKRFSLVATPPKDVLEGHLVLHHCRTDLVLFYVEQAVMLVWFLCINLKGGHTFVSFCI